MRTIAASLAGSGVDPCCCNGTGALDCQVKSGFPKLCGWAEFTDPSRPPLFYRVKTTTGTVYKAVWPSGCPATIPDGYVFSTSVSHAVAASNPPFGGMNGTATYTITMKMVSGVKNIRVQVAGSIVLSNPPYSPSAMTLNVNVSQPPGSQSNVFGAAPISGGFSYDSGFVPFSSAFDTVIVTSSAGGGGIPLDQKTDSFPFLGSSILTSMRDVWDLTDTYSATTCLIAETGTAYRAKKDFGDYPLTSGGTVQPDAPSETDYAGLVTETLTQTSRTLSGTNTCGTDPAAGDPGPSAKVSGDRVESLSEPDDPLAAVARDEATKAWQHCESGCGELCSAFTVQSATDGQIYYRDCQVRVLATGLTPGANYKATITLAHRVWGTGGPFVPFDTIEISFTAGSLTTFTTSWQQVPNYPGVIGSAMETIASTAVVVLQP